MLQPITMIRIISERKWDTELIHVKITGTTVTEDTIQVP